MSERPSTSPGWPVSYTTSTFERRGTPSRSPRSPRSLPSGSSLPCLPRPVLQELSGLTIGMWKSRAHESLYLLVLPTKFVFVVEAGPRASVARKSSFGSPRLGSLNASLNASLNTSLNASPILKQFVSASPFSYGQHASLGQVVFAFEVSYSSIAGVDFQNPLVRQGRMTVEAFGVEKREFGSLEALQVWYGVERAVERAGVCAVCGEGGDLVTRPTSAARKSLQFDRKGYSGNERGVDEVKKVAHEEGGGEVDGVDNRDAPTEASSFAFCVGDGVVDDEQCDENGEIDVDDAATSRRQDVGEDARKGGKKSRSPWSVLRLRRNAKPGSPAERAKRAPSTDNLPRLTIPSRSMSGDREHQSFSPSKSEKHAGRGETSNTEVTNKTYTYRTITAEFTSPHIPCVLAPVFKQHTQQSERLLKMYESGLPSWAMFLPSYGMYYRPWLRSVTWVFFYVFSVVSLTLGFYDLYKTLPGLQDALAKVVESYHISVWWPILSAYQWIEGHAQLRLSILLTYLFGKSELLNMAVTYVFEPVRVIAMPLVWVLFAPLRLLFSVGGYILYSPLTFAWSLASRVDMMQAARGSGAGIGMVSEAMRQSLVTTMRAANNVWKFVMNMSGGVSRHRMTLSRRAGRNWDRLQDVVLAVLERVQADIMRLLVGSTKASKETAGFGETEMDGQYVVLDSDRSDRDQNDMDQHEMDQQSHADHSLSFSHAFCQGDDEEDEVRSSLNERQLT